MSTALHLLAGSLLPVPAWLWLRRGARISGWTWLDAAPLAGMFCALLALGERPVLAGGLVGGACIVLGVADRAKRAALQEPLAFTDGGLLWQVLAHPRFYLPFVPRSVVAGGLGAGAAAFVTVVLLEPPLELAWPARAGLLVAALLLALMVLRPLWLLWRAGAGSAASPGGAAAAAKAGDAVPRTEPDARPPDQAPAPKPLRDGRLARDPALDADRFGPLATFALHARLAATERMSRRAAYPPKAAWLPSDAPRPHLLLLQLESFCDPRRFGIAQPLPRWDALAAAAVLRGRLAVPGFGANTMRTEFVVLTGLADAVLGLDRLNPYFRFARRPVTSLGWTLGGAGWATACLHPYDGRFFGRDRVLPALGFQRFEDAAAFAAAPREQGLVSDAALGARIVEELDAATDAPLFLYAISVAAHGPWKGADPAASWAARMVATDAMLGAVAAAARAVARPVVLAAFGDHRPSLDVARGATDTDYLIWRSDAAGGGVVQDLDAAALHRALRTAMGLGA